MPWLILLLLGIAIVAWAVTLTLCAAVVELAVTLALSATVVTLAATLVLRAVAALVVTLVLCVVALVSILTLSGLLITARTPISTSPSLCRIILACGCLSGILFCAVAWNRLGGIVRPYRSSSAITHAS